jgi:hypothetical protein
LATGDPPPNTVLPAEDSKWDIGDMTSSEPLYVTSPTSVKAGGFARTCQATHLMGRLVRLTNDRTDTPLRYTEGMQLYRTLHALGTILPTELAQNEQQFSTPLFLCYGALLHLCDPFCCAETNHGDRTVEETEMQVVAINGIKKAAIEVLGFAETVKMLLRENISAISPLMLDGLYMAAATFAWFTHESGSVEDSRNYHVLKEILIQMNVRWAAAGEFVKTLDATRDILYASNPNL